MTSNASPSKVDVSPHYVRITSGGKIKSWVDFSLNFFRENPGRPLILHTLPSTHPPGQSTSPTSSVSLADPLSRSVEESDEVKGFVGGGETNERSISASARNIPRLISVVEIIKREYFKELSPGPESTGLYQYNYLGFIEEYALNTDSRKDEEHRQTYIISALEGKNHLKQEKTPYMRITLCTSPLLTIDIQATCQSPSTKTLSRSARARQRRRSLRESGAAGKPEN